MINIKTSSQLLVLLLCSSQIVLSATTDDASYSWTGAYAGVNLGSVWTGSHLTANNISFLPDDGTFNENLNATAVNPGLQFGYLQQFKGSWVLGGEADFTYPDSSSQYNLTDIEAGEFDQFTVHNNLQGSLRLRAGYSIDRFLPFVTAGVSFASLGLNYNNEVNDSYRKTSTQTGWVLGGGLEYGVLENLSVRTEYLYTDYGNALNVNIPTIIRFLDPSGGAHATLYTNVLRAAVNYRF